MEKLLTIIIPAYNMETYLDRCVSSIIIDNKELLSLVEIIIVNDGSTDGTLAIAQAYQQEYHDSIIVVDKENRNYGSCINAGLALAQGKYIKVLDADDWFDKESFEGFVRKLKDLDVDLVVTEFSKVNQDRIVLWCSSYGQVYDVVLTSRDLDRMEPMQMHALCYRTALLRDHNYQQTTGISYTDTEWSVIPMLYVKKFVCLPINLYQYLVGRDGQTMDISVVGKRADQLVKTYSKCIAWIKNEEILGIASTYVSRKMYCCLVFLYYTILIDDKGNNAEKIIALDQLLKEKCTEFYSSLNVEIASPTSGFKFVQTWRDNGYQVKPMPLLNQIREFFMRNKLRVEWHWEHTILRRQV